MVAGYASWVWKKSHKGRCDVNLGRERVLVVAVLLLSSVLSHAGRKQVELQNSYLRQKKKKKTVLLLLRWAFLLNNILMVSCKCIL